MNSLGFSDVAGIFLCVPMIALAANRADAAGVVNNPTETDLRAAMAGGGTVTFACDGTIALTNTLVISSDTTLDGSGHSIILSGGGTVRVLRVNSDIHFTLKRLSVANGYAASQFSPGGGLWNSGVTTISDCIFSNNFAVAPPLSGVYGIGGAIDHDGTSLQITGTTFVKNGADTAGGAISCGFGTAATGGITITNCTFYENWAGVADSGGGVFMDEPLVNPVTIVNCTFAGNTNGAVDHKVTFLGGAGVRVFNSILADTVGSDAASGITDWGYNLSTDASASLTNGTSLKNTNPMLGPLEDSGGPTPTMALYTTSPAIDAASALGAPPTDQGGVARPFGSAPDIGAFEGSLDPAYPSTVQFSSTDFSVGEQSGTAAIQLERTGASGAVSVGLLAAPGTATDGADFVGTNMTVNFTPYEMVKTVPIIILQDSEVEPNETVLLTLHDPAGTTLGSPNAATLTIVDDDTGGQVITNLTDLTLRSAINIGGMIQFGVDGTLALTNPITVAVDTILDAGGHTVTISGGDAVRLFNVSTGVSLTLKNLIIANGRVTGATGDQSQDGGEGIGGAILINGGTLNILGCEVRSNAVYGGTGGVGNPNGSGGPGLGGAIYLDSGVVVASNSIFAGNVAVGGPGGANMVTFKRADGAGGLASGGVIYTHNASLTLVGCSFSSNNVTGGAAPTNPVSPGGPGPAQGAVILNEGGTAGITRCAFHFNTGVIQNRPFGPDSPMGTNVVGGAICNLSGNMTITGTDFAGNMVLGSVGVDSAPPSSAAGGAIFNLDQMLIEHCSFSDNIAQSGVSGVSVLNGADAHGGAIMNGGILSLRDCHLSQNSVTGSNEPGGVGLAGGAIHNTNHLVALDCTFDGNMVRSTADYVTDFGTIASTYGGAIATLNSCFLTNTTFAGNIARGGDEAISYQTPGNGFGGAIFNSGGTLVLASCTVSSNSAVGGAGNTSGVGLGGGIHSTNGAGTSLLNSLLAENVSGSNVYGAIVDLGHNISSDASCNFSGPGSLNNTDPKLGPLDNYGGPTPTMPLLAGSPAIDAGDPANFPPTDQRGRARPYGLAPDIGAFESSPPFVIRGIVSGFTLRDEVSVGADAITVSTTNHSFSLEGLAANTHSVTPSSPDYLFLPGNRAVTVGPDQLGVIFKAYHWNALSIDDVANGVLHLVFAGTNGDSYRLQTSSNLVQWSSIATNLIGSTNYFESFVPAEKPLEFLRTVSP